MGRLMDDVSVVDQSLPEDLLQPLLRASKSSKLKEGLEILIETSRIDDGRAHLASMDILPAVLQLLQSKPYSSGNQYLTLALKLLRNLCAGEVINQNLFIAMNGPCIVSIVLRSAMVVSEPDYGIIRMGLQLLANVALAGEEHQLSIWHSIFPDELVALAKLQNRSTLDPLCMIIYACCDGNPSLVPELWGNQGMPILTEIVRTASVVGFGEHWLKMLLSRICLEEVHFPQLFSRLYCVADYENSEDISSISDHFSTEQAYLLGIVSEILNERLEEITVTVDFAMFIFGIFKRSIVFMDSTVSGGKSGLPTGSARIDVLGYSLTILRDISAQISKAGLDDDSVDVTNTLLSDDLLELLLSALASLGPPELIKKAMRQNKNQELASSNSSKPCPYRGFRRDIVAVIGNCAFQRKNVQDEIRRKNGILLMLQQCVTDVDNPFLREWAIWSVRNLLEGNAENQQAVAELELQGSVDMPEFAGLGLRVEVDPKTRRAKLVNV
ncbi:ataxin-10 [Jatropha curcas]|uniref:ataxin-10 n=1 Tax=Jatropha curcas TaxID=180498 RepID=UPI0005FBECE3|nr:ataxin-10 [Jatropha curcas]XP_020538490.1 ataxin-10 [Jatropha curcas]